MGSLSYERKAGVSTDADSLCSDRSRSGENHLGSIMAKTLPGSMDS